MPFSLIVFEQFNRVSRGIKMGLEPILLSSSNLVIYCPLEESKRLLVPSRLGRPAHSALISKASK